MPSFSSSIPIQSPAERVFQYLTTPELLVEWIGGLERSTPLTTNGVVPGAKSEEFVRERGKLIRMVSSVREVVPAKRLVTDIENPSGRFVAAYELQAGNGTTIVNHRLDARFTGIAWLLAPLLRGVVQRKLDGDLSRLKQACERRPADRGAH